jgi:hypothetical protein
MLQNSYEICLNQTRPYSAISDIGRYNAYELMSNVSLHPHDQPSLVVYTLLIRRLAALKPCMNDNRRSSRFIAGRSLML